MLIADLSVATQAKLLKSYKRLTLAVESFDDHALPPFVDAVLNEEDVSQLRWVTSDTFFFASLRNLSNDYYVITTGRGVSLHASNGACSSELSSPEPNTTSSFTPVAIGAIHSSSICCKSIEDDRDHRRRRARSSPKLIWGSSTCSKSEGERLERLMRALDRRAYAVGHSQLSTTSFASSFVRFHSSPSPSPKPSGSWLRQPSASSAMSRLPTTPLLRLPQLLLSLTKTCPRRPPSTRTSARRLNARRRARTRPPPPLHPTSTSSSPLPAAPPLRMSLSYTLGQPLNSLAFEATSFHRLILPPPSLRLHGTSSSPPSSAMSSFASRPSLPSPSPPVRRTEDRSPASRSSSTCWRTGSTHVAEKKLRSFGRE